MESKLLLLKDYKIIFKIIIKIASNKYQQFLLARIKEMISKDLFKCQDYVTNQTYLSHGWNLSHLYNLSLPLDG